MRVLRGASAFRWQLRWSARSGRQSVPFAIGREQSARRIPGAHQAPHRCQLRPPHTLAQRSSEKHAIEGQTFKLAAFVLLKNVLTQIACSLPLRVSRPLLSL